MRFSITALLFLGASPLASAYSGKKGGGDCTEDAIVISKCGVTITKSGHYILEKNLNCDAKEEGIAIIGADNVLLDCQDNKIRGRLGDYGIQIADAEHITVTNCKVSGFFRGLEALAGTKDSNTWTDLSVTDSSFTENWSSGMRLDGRFSFTKRNVVTVVNSKFNENGNDVFGAGMFIQNVFATVISSSMVRNSGFLTTGFGVSIFSGTGSATLIDVKANDNDLVGISSPGNFLYKAPLYLYDTTACQNKVGDVVVATGLAQGNTCDGSIVKKLAGFDVCECPCRGGFKSASAASDVAAASNGTSEILVFNGTSEMPVFNGTAQDFMSDGNFTAILLELENYLSIPANESIDALFGDRN